MSLISKRAFAPTRDQPRVINHLVHSHRQSIGLALNDTAQRVADQQHFDPRLVEDPRKRVIVGRETGNLLAALLHFKDMRYGDLVAHDTPQTKKAFRTKPEGQRGQEEPLLSPRKIAFWHPSQSRLPGSKRYIVLRSRTHAVDFLDQVSQILAARHEINLRSIHHQQRRLIIVKKELIIRLSHFAEVFEGNASLVFFIPFFDSFVKHLGTSLQIDDQIRFRHPGVQ